VKCKDCDGEARRGPRCPACEYRWLYVLDPKRLAVARAKLSHRMGRPMPRSTVLQRTQAVTEKDPGS
jgi:hypothetical protein